MAKKKVTTKKFVGGKAAKKTSAKKLPKPAEKKKLSTKDVLKEIAAHGIAASSKEAQQAILAKAELDQMLGLAHTSAGHRVGRSPLAMEPHGGTNIVATSIQEKKKKNKPTGKLAIVVYVEKKSGDPETLGPAIIPKTIGGIATDVVEVGEVRPLASSCGNRVCGPDLCGTIGCVVELENSTANYILTNWHAVATGDPFLGRPVDDGNGTVIGALSHWVTPKPGNIQNIVDMALAKVVGTAADSSQCEVLGAPMTKQDIASRLAQMPGGIPVRKVGQKSIVTTGRVIRMDGDRKVNYTGYGIPGDCRFVDLVVIQPDDGVFSEGGDSGSLVVTVEAKPRPVGLLIGESGGLSFANRIGHVVATAKIKKFHAP